MTLLTTLLPPTMKFLPVIVTVAPPVVGPLDRDRWLTAGLVAAKAKLAEARLTSIARAIASPSRPALRPSPGRFVLRTVRSWIPIPLLL